MRGAIADADTLINTTEFQSARPMRGAILACHDPVARTSVSIRAPHEGRDVTALMSL